jgi:hypothetical protein
MRQFLPAARLLSPNLATAELVNRLGSEYRTLFGRRTARELMVSAAITGIAVGEWARISYLSDVRHPHKNIRRYRWESFDEALSGYMTPALIPEA